MLVYTYADTGNHTHKHIEPGRKEGRKGSMEEERERMRDKETKNNQSHKGGIEKEKKYKI